MGEAPPPRPKDWWKTTTVYQIWPASYKDGNGDGLGDIPGIISTIPYLYSLGVETIWLSPMYASPQVDMGYDISNYEEIYPPYGTMADMQRLIDELHARGMKIILDLVINHTSDQHAWFQESKRSKNSSNQKQDWYIWRPPKHNADGKRQPPNNWRSWFGGSAWEYVEARGEYYLHLFTKEQPDLNWENKTTREAIYNTAMRFWLRRGVDGFRIDTCNIYSKAPGLPDAPVSDPDQEFQSPYSEVVDGYRIHEYLREMRRVFDEFGEIMSVGELSPVESRERLLMYVDSGRRELNEVFDFGMVRLGNEMGDYKDFHDFPLSDVKAAVKKSQSLIDGTHAWITTFAENHDQARSITRFTTASEKYHDRAGNLLATLLATTSGTLFIYQGQEIGMSNIPASWPPCEYKDVSAQNYLERIRKTYPNDPEIWTRALAGLNLLGRDNARTPVQWDRSPNAGFTTSPEPWMRVNDNYPTRNVSLQQPDPHSLLSFWKTLVRLRREHEDLFATGKFELLDEEAEHTFCFFKQGRAGRRVLVQLNFSEERRRGWGPERGDGGGGGGAGGDGASGGVLACNVEGWEAEWLEPWEARVHLVPV